MMKKLLIILIIILSYDLVVGQISDFSKAVEAGRTSSASPTSGLYSYNPRLEGNYFCIDFYARRYTEWPCSIRSGRDFYDCSNHIGAFDISLDMSVVAGGLDYKAKFESHEFALSNASFNDGYVVIIKPSDRIPNVGTSTNRFSISYVNDVNGLPADEIPPRIKVGVPYFIGTLKLKIRDGLPAGTTSKMSFSTTAASVGMWHNDDNEVLKTTECVVLGYLDGKSMDISLIPEAESTVPADPVFASGTSPVCPGKSGSYALTGPAKNATGYDWWISATDKGSNINNASIGTVTKNADGLGATVAWGAAAGGTTYYVCVQAKNDKGEMSGVISWPVTVGVLPTVTIAAKSGSTGLTSGSAICGNLPLHLEVNSPQSGVTYTWSNGKTGSSQDIAALTNPAAPANQVYTVTAKNAQGCEASADINLTVNPTPEGLVFSPIDLQNQYPNGQLLSGTGITASKGGPLTSYNWNITYTNGTPAVTGTNPTIDFSVQGNTSVNVTVGNTYGCTAQKVHNITASGGITLALETLYAGSLLCNGGVLPLKVTVSGLSSGTYTYEWYSGTTATGTPLQTEVSTSTENIYAAAAAGNYTVKVLVNSLSATKTMSVSANSATATPIVVTSPIIAATSDKKVILVAAPQNPTGSFVWKWTPADKLNAVAEADKQYPLTAAITASTNYKVYMKNTSNCVSANTVTVKLPDSGDPAEQNLALKVSPSAASLCQGNTLKMKAEVTGVKTGSTPVYSWLPTAGLQNPGTATPTLVAQGITAGTYTYFVKATVDGKSMTAPVQVTISGSQAPVITKPAPIYCVESTLSMPPVSGLSYKWLVTDSHGNTTPTTANSIQFNNPDNYLVKIVGVTSGGCASDTVVFDKLDIRKLELAQKLNVEPTMTYVLGQDIVSTAEADKGWGEYVYSWTTPLPGKLNTSDNTYTITGASLSSYTFQLTARDKNGCVATAPNKTATATTGGLELAVDTMNAYCNGGMAMLQAKVKGGTPGSGYAYEWTLVGGDGTILSTNPVYLVKQPVDLSVYQVKVTDQSVPALVRTGTISLSAVKKTNATAPVLTTPGTITILPNSKAVLSAVAAPAANNKCRWNWTPADGFDLAAEMKKQYATTKTLSASKDYQVYMIDGNGCISLEKGLKVDIQNGADGGFNLVINASENMCKTSKQTLSATPDPEQNAADLSYVWSSSPVDLFSGIAASATPEIQPSAAGIYQIALTVTNRVTGKKNTAIKSIEVKNASVPTLEMNLSNLACEGDTVRVSVNPAGEQVAGGYSWYVDGVLQAGFVGNKLPLDGLTGSKVVKVVATGNNGCVADQEKTLEINTRPAIEWNPALPVTINVTESLTATALPVGGGATSKYNWAWAVTSNGTTVGTPTLNTYKVDTKVGDKKILLSVVATDKTTTCKSKPLPGEVIVAGAELELTLGMDGLACVNGSAVMVVKTILGDVGPYTYAWTKGSNATVIGTDSILIQPVTSSVKETYHVMVTNAGGKKGYGDIDVTGLTGKSVPTVIACADITIPVNTKAVLTANATGTKPYVWTWRPAKDLQALSEAALQSPVTRQLDGDTDYYVRVKDASGCVSKEDNLKVMIDGSKALKVEIVPDVQLCINNHVRYRAIVTDKDGQAVTVVDGAEWKAMEAFTAVSGDLLAIDYTAQKARVDTIVVVVKKGNVTATAKKMITIKPNEVPSLQFDKAVSCAGDQLGVTVNQTGAQEAMKNYTWIVSKNGGTPNRQTNGKYTFTDAGSYQVKVVGNTQNCMTDTLSQTLTIAPIPVIENVLVSSGCGGAEVVAVTKYADSWEWKFSGAFNGSVVAGKDSICEYRTTQMSQAFTGSVIAKNSTAGCASAEKSYNGTAYALPKITMNPVTTSAAPKSVYPNTQLPIEATLVPNLAYSMAWSEDGVIIPGETTNKLTTSKLAIRDQQYKFAIEVTNTANTTCKVADTVYVAVDNKDFRVSFGQDTIDICQNVDAKFCAKVENNKFGTVSYSLGSSYPGFNASADAMGNFHYTFSTAGTYKVWVQATNQNIPPDVRKDTVVVRVNPTPGLNMDLTAGKSYFLCANKGEVKVNMTATGSAAWKLYYKLGTQKQESFVTSPHSMKLTEGGTFAVDSIVDSKGCKFTPNKMGFIVVDDVPRIELSSTDSYKKCQGMETDLGLKVTAIPEDYEMTLHYWVGFSEKTFVYKDAATKFASKVAGEYTIDSIVSKRGCVYRLADKNVVTVEDYPESTPTFVLTDKGDKLVCGQGAVEIPLSITGGKPKYTLTYYMKGGADQTLVLDNAGAGKLTVNGSGTFVVKAFADANGCGDFILNDSVRVKKSDPVVEIDSMDFAVLGGQNFILGVKNPNTAELGYTWQKDNGSFVNPNLDGIKYQDAITRDARYVLKGSSKTVTGCFGTDTVNVYKIPDAPTISIDTNKTRYDLVLKFNSLNVNDKVDGYQIMKNKWDGYALATPYQPLVKSYSNTTYALAANALDTLEFFYVQAYRKITTGKGEQTYYSGTSDTVGYIKQIINATAGATKTNINYISYPFDMKEKGIVKLSKLGEYLGKKQNGKPVIKTVAYFDFPTQVWQILTYLEALGKWTGVDTDLKPGTVYFFTIDKSSVNQPIIMYGKLPSKFAYNLQPKVSGKTGNNYILAPLSSVQNNRRQLLGDIIPNKLTVGIPAFGDQIWNIATYLKALNRWTPTLEVEKPPVIIRPWMPVGVTVEAPVLNWVK